MWIGLIRNCSNLKMGSQRSSTTKQVQSFFQNQLVKMQPHNNIKNYVHDSQDRIKNTV